MSTAPEIESQLTEALARLGEDEFVVAGEPVPEETRRGLRRFLPGGPPVARYVQARVIEGDLLLEAVGARAWGGYADIDPDTDRAIRDLGWPGPDDPDWNPIGGPLYRRWAPADQSTDATAALLVRTLTTLGVDLDTVTLTTG